MKRSEIREIIKRGDRPGLRFAPSGLRGLWRFISQPVNPLGLRESCDRKFAEIAPAAGAYAGNACGAHEGAMQPAADLLQPRREIDGGADAGEVEPVAAADIAVEDFSDVQRHPEAKALDGFRNRGMHGIDAGAGFARGFPRAGA